jgi:hypothetical protein
MGGACARPCAAACADRFGGSSDGAARAICFGLVPATGCDRRRRSTVYCAQTPEALGRPIAHAGRSWTLAGRSWTRAGGHRLHTGSMDIPNPSSREEIRRHPRASAQLTTVFILCGWCPCDRPGHRRRSDLAVDSRPQGETRTTQIIHLQQRLVLLVCLVGGSAAQLPVRAFSHFHDKGYWPEQSPGWSNKSDYSDPCN